jgi:hypothetical protein
MLLGLQSAAAGAGGSDLGGDNDEHIFFSFKKNYLNLCHQLMQIKIKQSPEK